MKSSTNLTHLSKLFLLGFVFTFIIFFLSCALNKTQNALQFDASKYETKTVTSGDNSLKIRAFEGIVYVEKPVDTTYQVMNIYIPEAYFNGETINGYTAETAPIFYPNQVGGYMPANPATTEPITMGMLAPAGGKSSDTPAKPAKTSLPSNDKKDKINTVAEALIHGYVVASAGARGRTKNDGKAPAAIVDLKAGVRYLKFNDKNMPGDAQKIITNGTSAGGAMSSLLGATGNHPDYEPFLKALGAADADDNVFATSAYCPITNLDHADMAYEWQFFGHNDFQEGGPMATNTGVQELSETQIKVSTDLKNEFPAYLNGLNLKNKNGEILHLDSDGNGNFKDLIKSYVVTSANIASAKGTQISQYSWLKVSDGKATDMNWDGFVTYQMRQKTPPAFDALDLSAPENQEFGSETIDKQHFTKYSLDHSTAENATIANDLTIKVMNPMNYIGDASAVKAKHWRIRAGTKDRDTGLAISVMLATLLENNNLDTNLKLPWNVTHSGDYDIPELFEWIDQVVKN